MASPRGDGDSARGGGRFAAADTVAGVYSGFRVGFGTNFRVGGEFSAADGLLEAARVQAEQSGHAVPVAALTTRRPRR